MAADMITCSQLGSKLTRVLANNAAANLQNAWHLLSLVLASGRPDRLRELLSRCKFLRFTLCMIGSLCSLPLFLTPPNGIVSIIRSAFVAFTQALWNLWSGLAFVPRSLRYLARKGSLANVTKVYSRKRKRNVTGIQALSGGDMGAPGGKCPPIFLDTSTQAQTVPAKKLKQNRVEKGHSTGQRKKSLQTDGKLISTSHKVAKRKLDGVTLAIKYVPLAILRDTSHTTLEINRKCWSSTGVNKNFIKKYEGSFEHGSADCLVLQHFEHERPEVSKKEIDLFQLQWYAYCLFRALSSLHKQGVIHRDVKPGNFLFSRMANKGYLIDFNLAVNVCKKYRTTESNPPAKAGPSNKVLSSERLKEPVPSRGRKELLSLAAKAMQGPNHEAASPPTSKRKRIASPCDNNIVYLAPMPLHSSGVAIAAAGIVKSRWKWKTKEEGPYVGTKDFRAPEVLLKSPFDVWCAGSWVTLVYLSNGRSPFGGDPDQNKIDIADLRAVKIYGKLPSYTTANLRFLL